MLLVFGLTTSWLLNSNVGNRTLGRPYIFYWRFQNNMYKYTHRTDMQPALLHNVILRQTWKWALVKLKREQLSFAIFLVKSDTPFASCKIRVRADWTHTGSLPALLYYQYVQQAKKPCPQILQLLRSSSPCRLRVPPGSTVVQRQPNNMEWESPAPTINRSDHRDQCYMSRMGAHFQGVSTGGRWLPQETSYHNCIELLAGSLSHNALYQERSQGLGTAVDGHFISSLHKQNGVDTLPHAVLSCQKYVGLLSHLQCLSDSSIHSRSTECRGSLGIQSISGFQWLRTTSSCFQRLCHKWGLLNLDLFTSWLWFQLDQFVSWRPDPLEIHTNAFTLAWATFRGYAVPLFALIGWCIHQIQSKQVSHTVFVAPVWPTQPWYPLLLHLSIDFPLLIQVQDDFLTQGITTHPLKHSQLAGWLLSTEDTKRQTFLTRVENSSWKPGGKKQLVPIPVHAQTGIAGVIFSSYFGLSCITVVTEKIKELLMSLWQRTKDIQWIRFLVGNDLRL